MNKHKKKEPLRIETKNETKYMRKILEVKKRKTEKEGRKEKKELRTWKKKKEKNKNKNKTKKKEKVDDKWDVATWT